MRPPVESVKRDLWLAAAVTAVAEIELFVSRSSVSGPLAAWFLTNLLILPALALRRVRPLAAVGVAAISFGIGSVVGEAPVAVPFLALLFLVASSGWYAPLGQGLLGIGVLLVVGLLPSVARSDAAADLVVNAAIIVGAWAAGHGLRRASERLVHAEVTADRAARDAVVAERERISRDLHDSMAHALTLITLQAGSARERMQDDTTAILLGDIETTGREALDDMHRYLELAGHEGRHAPGLVDLAALLDGVERSGLTVHLDLDLAEELPESISTAAYRVVQEALTNVVRHSGATHARVGVTQDAGQVVVCVTDDGRPLPSRLTGAGRGLTGLSERLGLLGGRVESGPHQGGWRLEAHIPLGAS